MSGADRGVRRPGWPAYLGYGLGDFAFNFVWGSCLAYSVYFYTDVCRIPVTIVAGLVLVARILNAVIDPLVGLWIDGRQTGERVRPLLKWGAIPLGLALALSFVPLDASVTVKAFWAGFTYLALNVIYSAVNIPYGVLLNLMSADGAVRVKLATARMLGASISIILVGLATLDAADLLGAGVATRGFMLYGILLGTATGAVLLSSYALTFEDVSYVANRPTSRQFVSSTLGDRNWMALTASMTLSFVASTMIFGMATYFAIYGLNENGSFGGSLLSLTTFASLGGVLLAPAASARMGELRVCLLSNVGLAVMMAGVALFTPAAPMTLALFAIVGIFIGVREPAIYALLARAIDPDETSGKGAIGLGYALNSAFCKAALGVGGALIALLLGAGGYNPGTHVQSVETVTAIRFGFGAVPAFLFLLSAGALFGIRMPSAAATIAGDSAKAAR
ncbi:sugar transporter [Sphingobium chlorophenolicum L-1]|uniref:Sugar transporter n=1 Tax=Sphingobium chlorophenolicum L-1 TaxID=690566 RepID=F6ETQ2_SPHCR|nr:MFS transporter [Sphingobium chlorophenolicum]AEG49547.1 sugar transporter [Sphingobium chlorophenolicum L-1]